MWADMGVYKLQDIADTNIAHLYFKQSSVDMYEKPENKKLKVSDYIPSRNKNTRSDATYAIRQVKKRGEFSCLFRSEKVC